MSSRGIILVVDDDPECLDLAISLLGAEGYLVRPAMSGEAALEPMAAWPPDLILLDVRMPGMGGFETCRRLRASEETADVPLIFLSAAESLEEHLEGLALGAVDFIVKPLRREELLARVRTQIELGRLRAGLRLREGDDISPARHTESASDDPEQRFRNLADTAPMMICASGPDKRATFFNKAWLSFTGRALEQEIGNGWTEGVHPDDLESAYASYASSFDARRKCHIQYRLRHANGEYRWIVCCGVPQYASSGTFTGYIASGMDITELRRTQEEAFERQKLEGLRVLTGGIAHDFNNLLGSILAEADLAEADLAEGVSPLEGIVRIKGVANRAAEHVGAAQGVDLQARAREDGFRQASPRRAGQCRADPPGGDEPDPECFGSDRRRGWRDPDHHVEGDRTRRLN
jgi:PAS domain S-box-containing protein